MWQQTMKHKLNHRNYHAKLNKFLHKNIIHCKVALRNQEAQLLQGDRATRKPAKDSWNGHANDKLGWNDLQMYFKVIKSGTNWKLVYDFLLVLCSHFCRITHRLREIWCETVEWPWNIANVINVSIIWKQTFGFLLAISVSMVVSYIISEILDLGGWNELHI